MMYLVDKKRSYLKSSYLRSPDRQKGVVLVIALVVLSVLSVMVMSSSQTMVLNAGIVSNQQKIHQAYQAAESCVEYVKADEDLINQAITAAEPILNQAVPIDLDGVTVTVDLNYYEVDVADFDLEEFQMALVEITCVSQLEGESISETVVVGTSRLIPNGA